MNALSINWYPCMWMYFMIVVFMFRIKLVRIPHHQHLPMVHLLLSTVPLHHWAQSTRSHQNPVPRRLSWKQRKQLLLIPPQNQISVNHLYRQAVFINITIRMHTMATLNLLKLQKCRGHCLLQWPIVLFLVVSPLPYPKKLGRRALHHRLLMRHQR